MKLIHKLVLGYLIISSFGVLTTYIAIRSFQSVENTFNNLTGEVVPKIELLQDMKSASLRIVSSSHEIVSLRSGGAADVEAQIEEEQIQIRKARERYQQSLAAYEREYSSSDEARFAEAMRISGQWLIDRSARLIEAKNSGVRGAEMTKLRGLFEKAEDECVTS